MVCLTVGLARFRVKQIPLIPEFILTGQNPNSVTQSCHIQINA
jgi:hypothetical protein